MVLLIPILLFFLTISHSSTIYYETAKLESVPAHGFYGSVDIFGNYAIIGDTYNDNNSVYIFTESDGIWAEINKFHDLGDFGYSVSIYNNTLVIGAPLASNWWGIVYTYYKDINNNWLYINTLECDCEYIQFGQSISMKGDYMLVLATYNSFWDGGMVYVYKTNNNNFTWIEMDILSPDDNTTDTAFGANLDLDELNNYAVIGATEEKYGFEDDAGAVYIFQRNYDESWTKIEKIISPNADNNNYFGSSVAMHQNYIIIGETGENSIYIYQLNRNNNNIELIQTMSSSWVYKKENDPDRTYISNYDSAVVGIYNDYLVISRDTFNYTTYYTRNSHIVTLYKKDEEGTGFNEIGILNPSDGTNQDDYYGKNIAINNQNVIVSHQGISYIFNITSNSNTLSTSTTSTDIGSSESSTSNHNTNDIIVILAFITFVFYI